MTLTADDMVNLSLDDICKMDRQAQPKKKPQGQQKKKPGQGQGQGQPGSRKPLKQSQGGQARKPGQAARKSAVQAQNKRNSAFNQSRGIKVEPMSGVTTAGVAGGAKKKKKTKPNKVVLKAAAGGGGGGGGGGGVKLNGGGGKKPGFVFGTGGGGGGGGKAVAGPPKFTLPKGTSLKISISNPAASGGGKSQPKKKSPAPILVVGRGGVGRVGLKATQSARQGGQGALARRMGQITMSQNKRQSLFNQGRGLPSGGGGGGGGRGRGRSIVVRNQK